MKIMKERKMNVDTIVDSVYTIGNELERIAKDNGINLVVYSKDDSNLYNEFCDKLQISSIVRDKIYNGDTSFDCIINSFAKRNNSCDVYNNKTDIVVEKVELYTNTKLFNLKEDIGIDKIPFKMIVATCINDEGYIKHIPVGVGIRRDIKHQILDKTSVSDDVLSLLKMFEICMVYSQMVMNEFCDMIDYMNTWVYNSYIHGISQNVMATYYEYHDINNNADDYNVWDVIVEYINNIPFYAKAFDKLNKRYPISKDEFVSVVLKSIDEFINE